MRLVLDTNVVASAMLWGGTPLSLLQAAREQRVSLFTSTALLAELTRGSTAKGMSASAT